MYIHIAKVVQMGSNNDQCFIQNSNDPCYKEVQVYLQNGPRHEKTGFLPMRKQRRRSAWQ